MPANPIHPAIPDSADPQTRQLWRLVLDRLNFLVEQVDDLTSRPAVSSDAVTSQIRGLQVSLAAVKDSLLQNQTLVSFGNNTPVEGNPGTVTSVGGTGSVNGISLSGLVTSSGNLTLGGTLSGINLATQVTGTLPTANGGTGQTSFTEGQLLIGNQGGGLTKATLTAGSGVSITNGDGSITIQVTGAPASRSYAWFVS